MAVANLSNKKTPYFIIKAPFDVKIVLLMIFSAICKGRIIPCLVKSADALPCSKRLINYKLIHFK